MKITVHRNSKTTFDVMVKILGELKGTIRALEDAKPGSTKYFVGKVPSTNQPTSITVERKKKQITVWIDVYDPS